MRKVVRNRKPDKGAKANSGSSFHSVRLVEGGAEGRGQRGGGEGWYSATAWCPVFLNSSDFPVGL